MILHKKKLQQNDLIPNKDFYGVAGYKVRKIQGSCDIPMTSKLKMNLGNNLMHNSLKN